MMGGQMMGPGPHGGGPGPMMGGGPMGPGLKSLMGGGMQPMHMMGPGGPPPGMGMQGRMGPGPRPGPGPMGKRVLSEYERISLRFFIKLKLN